MSSVLSPNTDTESLFVTHTVPELNQLHKQLQHELDQKKQDLRIMVGERYRDLMEAADTITHMQRSSESVISSVQNVIRISGDLESKHLVGFSKERYAEQSNSPYMAVASEIKLLMDVPEKIWTSFDRRDYIISTQLYLFARHVHTNLMMEGGGGANSKVASWFPFISRQWESISHFHETIIEGCEELLSHKETTVEDAVKAIASVALLRGSDSTTLFRNFLTLREKTLQAFLRNEKLLSAKVLITQTIEQITSTLKIVNSAFRSPDLTQCLAEITNKDAPRTLSLFNTKMSPVMKFIPAVIADFRPALICPAKEMDRTNVKTECTTWLDRLHELVTSETTLILQHVKTIESLVKIRKSIYEWFMESPDFNDWNEICTNILDRKLNLWDEFYRNVYRERIEGLIMDGVNASVMEVQTHVDDCLSNGEKVQSEVDSSAYVWSEENSNESKVLKLKSRGFSLKVNEVCSKFDSALEDLMNDVMTMTQGKPPLNPFPYPSPSQQREEAFSLTGDNESILNHLKQTLVAQVVKLVSHVQTQRQNFKDEDRGRFIHLARLFQAIPELCPTLYNTISLFTTKTDPIWNELKAKIEAESCHLFSSWKTNLLGDMKATLTTALVTDNQTAYLELMSQWDHVTISEEAEDGKAVESKIRVPQYPSLVLMSTLDKYSTRLYQVCPHSFPVAVQHSLSQEAVGTILQVYREVATLERMPQNVALQLSFDLKFIAQCMISRDNRDLLQTQQSTLATMENHIDPFDLDVFTPYITTHVKRSILREQATLGVMIPPDRHSLLASLKSTLPQQTAAEHHNVLASTCATGFRFPLLPVGGSKPAMAAEKSKPCLEIVAPSSALSPGGASASKTRPKRDRSPSAAKVAGSFFEAMSSSWFGGKS